MKKTLFILFFTALFISCNQSPNQKDSDKGDSHDHHETTELTLNNGAKWQADTMTNLHLLRLKSIANQFKDVFEELKAQEDFVSKVIYEEEQSFLKTLETGIKRFDQYFSEVGNDLNKIPGKFAFELYDPLTVVVILGKHTY